MHGLTQDSQADVFSRIDVLLRAFHKSVDHVDWWPIHALVRTPFCRPYVLQMALFVRRDELAKWNDRGMLPLHEAVSCRRVQQQDFPLQVRDDDVPDMPLFSKWGLIMIRHLLEAYPEAANLRTRSGRSALHLAVESNQSWDAIQLLLAAAPDSLTTQDSETGLYPFMLAAVGSNCELDVVYKLLCSDPELVRSGVHGTGGDSE